MKYFEIQGTLDYILRGLESTEDKLNYLASDLKCRSESDADEKRRILIKLRDYFQNGETFKITKERETFQKLLVLKKVRF
jgi:hypothetical protein